MTRFTVFALMKNYVGKVLTIRNEIRTERQMNALPAHLRADIGWPDRHAEQENSRQ